MAGFSDLTRNQKLDLFILFTLALAVISILSFSSLLIRVISSEKAYVPNQLDYFRTFILAGLTSLLVNYTFRYITKFVLLLKLWIEFVALMLLSYPQKTDINRTFSSWNLVKREAFLFGVFYQIVGLAFYLYDQYSVKLFEQTEEIKIIESYENINEIVRQKSTLSNCIQIRRNSSNLRKILYPESFTDDLDLIKETDSEQAPLQTSRQSSLNDLIINGHSSLLDHGSHGSPATLYPIQSYGSILSTAASKNSNKGETGNFGPSKRAQWILDHLNWIVVSSLYEIGISLYLSLTFIYVPSLNDKYFTYLEKVFYNKILLFNLEVILPLFIITSIVQFTIYHSLISLPTGENPDDHSRKVLSNTYIGYITLAVSLFLSGILIT